MGVGQELESVVQRVPPWGWLALGGGALLLVFSRHNATAAAVVDPNAVVPNVDNGGGGTPITDPGTGVTPGVTPDPNNGGIIGTPPALFSQKLTDIWGGTLDHLIGAMTNQPDYVNLQLPGGGGLTYSNGIPTAGGGNGTPLIDQATVDAGIVHEHEYYQTLRDYNAGGVAAYQSWLQYLAQSGLSWVGGLGTPQGPQNGVTPLPTEPNGNVVGIAARCNRGDTQCARRVAPWWNGEPIPGWN